MDHEGWSVGGRSYGALLVFLAECGKYIPRLPSLRVAGLMVKALILYTLAVNAFMGIFYTGYTQGYGDSQR